MYEIIMTNGSVCNGLELYHHGILGQKWGIRRYQNEDGTLTEAGKKHMKNYELYKSSTSRKMEKEGHKGTKAYKASRELDKKLAERYAKNAATGKRALERLLLGDVGMTATYDMARAVGESRVKAALRSIFDLNVSTMANAAINGVYDFNANSLDNPNGAQANITRVAGAGVGDVVGSALKRSGAELSLQQRAIRKKYIKEHS